MVERPSSQRRCQENQMKTRTDTQAEIERLKAGGWTQLESGSWLREGMNPRLGGHTTGGALEAQNKLDVIAKYGAYYYCHQDRHGFGYFIGSYRVNLENPRRTGIDHLTEEEAKKLVKRFNSEKDYEPIRDIDYHPQEFEIIALFKEKYGDRYFIVHTRQDLEKVALKIVLEREEQNWYDFDYEKPTEPTLTIEVAEKFGMSGVAAATKQEWETYKYNKKQYERGIVLKSALEKIIKEKDGKTALQFLQELKGGEYEAFEIISGESLE